MTLCPWQDRKENNKIESGRRKREQKGWLSAFKRKYPWCELQVKDVDIKHVQKLKYLGNIFLKKDGTPKTKNTVAVDISEAFNKICHVGFLSFSDTILQDDDLI